MSEVIKDAIKPLLRYMSMKGAAELKAVDYGAISVELVDGTWKHFKDTALDPLFWRKLAQSIAIASGQYFDDQRHPLVRARLPGGHRLMLLYGSSVKGRSQNNGIAVTIRLLRPSGWALNDFGMPEEILKLVTEAIDTRKNVLLSGGTNCGKTSLLRVLCDMVKDPAPILVEDTDEIVLTQPLASMFLVSAVAPDGSITYQEVLDAITRSRPDRVVLGEFTSDNAFISLRLLNLGHSGLLGSIHADDANEAIPAICELLALRGYSAPHAEAFYNRRLDYVMHMVRVGKRRIVSHVFQPTPDGGKSIWRNPECL